MGRVLHLSNGCSITFRIGRATWSWPHFLPATSFSIPAFSSAAITWRAVGLLSSQRKSRAIVIEKYSMEYAEGGTVDLLQTLNWRYATKKMDPTRSVPKDKVDRILEAARLAPTSSGLQPFEIIVVTNTELRARIRPIAWNQAQITDCSHLLVFAVWDNYTAERINMMFDLTENERRFTNEGFRNYRTMLLDRYPSRSAEENFQHAAKQAYIALGFAMIAAATEEVDCTPMEGFDSGALDGILDLPARGLRSVLLLPLGYRDAANDWLVNLKKVRRPREQFITEMK